MSGFDLNLLRPLDALLQTRSVTEAARNLGVSQPTMSGMLARLRDQFADPLLVRVGKNMTLTPRAEELVSEVRQLLLYTERLTRPKTDFNPATLHRNFRIMASEYGLFLVLPAVLRKIGAIAPQVTFEAVSLDLPIASVNSGKVDLCLAGNLTGDVPNEVATAVRTRKVLEDRFVGIVDQSHPLKGKTTLAELHCYPYVAPQFPGVRWEDQHVEIEGHSQPPPQIRVPGFLAIGRLVADTKSVGIVPEKLAGLITSELGLRAIELPDAFRRIAVNLLWHERDGQDPAQRWIRSLIVEQCRSVQQRSEEAIS